MAGWGGSLALIAAVPFRRKEPWAWWAIAGPFTLWFVLDTAASLRFGVGFNAALNTALFIPVAAALAASWRAFRPGT